MRLKLKILLLAALPLVLALGLIAAAVFRQQQELARRELQLVEDATMRSRREELRNYVALGISAVKPLYDSGRTDEATRAEALRRIATLDYGSDGYFFVYDLDGTVLMHSRQPELIGRNLWDMQGPDGRYTIRRLIAHARAGGGFVDYPWR